MELALVRRCERLGDDLESLHPQPHNPILQRVEEYWLGISDAVR